MLTNEKLREANVARCAIWHKDEKIPWTTAQWCVAMCGEVGEVLDQVKKLNRITSGIPGNKRTDAQVVEDLGSELCDVILYADLLAHECGIGPEELKPLSPGWLSTTGPLNTMALALFAHAGDMGLRLSRKVVCQESKRLHDVVRYSLNHVRAYCHEIAERQGIDLEDAIVSKFNETSRTFELGVFL